MGDVADRIHGHPHAIPGPPECSVAFGAPCPAGLALVLDDFFSGLRSHAETLKSEVF